MHWTANTSYNCAVHCGSTDYHFFFDRVPSFKPIKPMYMHKRTKSQNCEFFCFIKVVALKKAIFNTLLTFGQFHQKRGLIGQKQN